MGWLERYREAFDEMEAAFEARAERARHQARRESSTRWSCSSSCRAATTSSARRSASSRTALAARDGRRLGARPTSACSTSPPAPGSSPKSWCERYGCRVVGIDQSAAMLERARAKLAGDRRSPTASS